MRIPRAERGTGGSRELVVLERLLILAELLVKDGEVGEDQLATAWIPGLGGDLFDAPQAEADSSAGHRGICLEEMTLPILLRQIISPFHRVARSS